MSSAVLELTESTFDEEIGSSLLPVMVEFWAEWCPPCQVLSPVLDALADELHDQLRVFKINSDEQPALARRYEVMSVPTVLLFSQGELRRRLIGARSRVRLLEELSDLI
jgi:thioredoxin 1